MTESIAMDAVLTDVSGIKEFEERGERDAGRLKRFLRADSIVLDLGCGIGRLEKPLAPYCKEIHGVDVSDRMIAFARKRLRGIQNVHFCRNNGHDLLIFHSEMFDFAFSLLVIQHLDKLDAYLYLEELYRVLKKGGMAYLEFPNFLTEHFFKDFLRQAKSDWRRDVGRTRMYTEPEVEMILGRIGFEILNTTFGNNQIIELCRKPWKHIPAATTAGQGNRVIGITPDPIGHR